MINVPSTAPASERAPATGSRERTPLRPEEDQRRRERVASAIAGFVRWLDGYGEVSLDFQTVYAGAYGRWAKSLYYRHRSIGTLAVAPLVFCEAFVPAARRCWAPQRFPIGDAHYAMAFARRHHYTHDPADLGRAVHFLECLLASAVRAPHGLGWGYPFDWVTIDGTIARGTSLITTLPYVYEAFEAVHALTGEARWASVLRAIAQHACHDYPVRSHRGRGASSAYTPSTGDRGGVVNASAYRAFLLTRAGHDLGVMPYRQAAEPNLEFVLDAQNPDGSWYYAMDGRRDFIDHFHTCFVLKALLKIEQLTGDGRCTAAIAKGLRYYLDHLFDGEDLPRPFARAPRFTFYRRELYDYAEAINVLSLAQGLDPVVETRRNRVVDDVLHRWQQPDGCFRTRQLLFGWDEVPMHRWGQSQLLRSLCGLLIEPCEATRAPESRKAGSVHA